MYDGFPPAGAGCANVTVFVPAGSLKTGNCCCGLMIAIAFAGAMRTLSQCQVFGGQFASPVGLCTRVNWPATGEQDFATWYATWVIMTTACPPHEAMLAMSLSTKQ